MTSLSHIRGVPILWVQLATFLCLLRWGLSPIGIKLRLETEKQRDENKCWVERSFLSESKAKNVCHKIMQIFDEKQDVRDVLFDALQETFE